MFELTPKKKIPHWTWLGLVLVAALGGGGEVAAERGQYGGDMSYLRRFYTPPQSDQESNHYLDLWSPGTLPVLARVNGLTNNHTLFVDSHGKAGCAQTGSGYGLYPKEELLERGQKMPYYSARDLSSVLGPASRSIHNIVIAGCNEEGRFSSQEVRRFFPNATNVTYMVAGQLSYKPMFYQAIVLLSTEIKPLYGRARVRAGRVECDIVDGSEPGAKLLGAYVADLYMPGADLPFRRQAAGRELLDPGYRQTAAFRTRELTPGGAVCARDGRSRQAMNDREEVAPLRRPPIIIVAEKPGKPEGDVSMWTRAGRAFFDWWNGRPAR